MDVYICPKASKALKDFIKTYKLPNLESSLKEKIEEALLLIKKATPDKLPLWIIPLQLTKELSLYKIKVPLPGTGKGKSGGLRLYIARKPELEPSFLVIFHSKGQRERYKMKDILSFLQDCINSLNK